jgi:hypothetical protein
LERTHQGLDFAYLATIGGIDNVQQTELRLVLRDCGGRDCVDKVQFPVTRKPVAVFEQSRKVIAGLEEYHGNIRQMLAKQM